MVYHEEGMKHKNEDNLQITEPLCVGFLEHTLSIKTT